MDRDVIALGLRLRGAARAGCAAAGVLLIGSAVLLALDEKAGGSLALAALLSGVGLIVASVAGQLPSEVGLQRVSFADHATEARRYQRELVGAAARALPEASGTSREVAAGAPHQVSWVEYSRLHFLVIWSPSGSAPIDLSLVGAVLDHLPPDGSVLVVTNADDIGRLRRAVRRRWRGQVAVTRWLSTADNPALAKAANRLHRSYTSGIEST